MRRLTKLSDNDLSELTDCLCQLRNRISDFRHVSDFISPKLIKELDKGISECYTEYEKREEESINNQI